MKITPGKHKGLMAVSNDRGVIAAAAMDQRGSLRSAIAKDKGVDKKEVTAEMMVEFKEAVVRVLTPHASAILLDPEFGLSAAKKRAKNAGLLLAYEKIGLRQHPAGPPARPAGRLLGAPPGGGGRRLH
jgi:Tagatose-1,6-bisphosphate aldolase